MIIGTLIAISAFFFGYVIVRIVQNQIVYTRFKRNARGLRLFAPTWSPIGHLAELSSDPLIQIKIEAYHRSYGKTFGAIFYDAPMVSTIDLDLIKAMVLDEPNLNINRFKFPMPDGMEKDTLGFAEGDQWRKIRRAISPSFTLVHIYINFDLDLIHFQTNLNFKSEQETSGSVTECSGRD